MAYNDVIRPLAAYETPPQIPLINRHRLNVGYIDPTAHRAALYPVANRVFGFLQPGDPTTATMSLFLDRLKGPNQPRFLTASFDDDEILAFGSMSPVPEEVGVEGVDAHYLRHLGVATSDSLFSAFSSGLNDPDRTPRDRRFLQACVAVLACAIEPLADDSEVIIAEEQHDSRSGRLFKGLGLIAKRGAVNWGSGAEEGAVIGAPKAKILERMADHSDFAFAVDPAARLPLDQ